MAVVDQSEHGIGECPPLTEADFPMAPETVFVELGNAIDRVVTCVVVVAGEIALFSQQPPSGHLRASDGFE